MVVFFPHGHMVRARERSDDLNVQMLVVDGSTLILIIRVIESDISRRAGFSGEKETRGRNGERGAVLSLYTKTPRRKRIYISPCFFWFF